jgi:hypothetical protein
LSDLILWIFKTSLGKGWIGKAINWINWIKLKYKLRPWEWQGRISQNSNKNLHIWYRWKDKIPQIIEHFKFLKSDQKWRSYSCLNISYLHSPLCRFCYPINSTLIYSKQPFGVFAVVIRKASINSFYFDSCQFPKSVQ